MKKLSILIFVVITLISCGKAEKNKSDSDKSTADIKQLLSYMTGSFSSHEQSVEDTSFYDIRLEMVPIWKERTDGYWLYVEQAVADYLDKPYRQRVYHLTQFDDSTLESAVYMIDEPLRFAGVWKEAEPLSGLTPDSLTLRDGCSIMLKPENDGSFSGSTVGNSCISSLRGASYAVSEVKITEDYLYSWDRGYDSVGVQVWGAEKGGYMFKKIIEVETDHE